MRRPGPDNRDMVIGLSLFLGALILRFYGLAELGLTHFDEGSYTRAGHWLVSLGREGNPLEPGHAPPLFPSLVALSFLLFGTSDSAAIGVSAVAGSLTVPLIYWIGRTWFSRAIGVAAGLFLATCEYHLFYSRMALTDATFVFLFWAGISMCFVAFQSSGRKASLVAGLLTGLAWNTKYHGMLVLLVFVLWVGWQERFRWPSVVGVLRRCHFPVMVLAAVLLTLPWIALVAGTIGLGAVVGGQVSHTFLATGEPPTWPSTIAFYLTSWIAFPLLFAALVGIVAAPRQRQTHQLLIVATFTPLFAALLYLSFPRLILPAIPGFCLLAALGASKLSVGRNWGMVLGVAVITVSCFWTSATTIYRPTDGYRRAFAAVSRLDGPVFSQLSKNYYFYDRGRSLEIRHVSVDALEDRLDAARAGYVIVDPVLWKLVDYQAWFESIRTQLTLIERLEINAYDPIFLQGFNPLRPHLSRVERPFRKGEASIEIYAYQSSEGARTQEQRP